MAEVGSAFVSLLPSARGFGRKLDAEVGPQIDAAGKSGGSRFGKAFGALAAVGAGAAIGGFIKNAVGLEAEFGKTMSVLQATTKAPKAEMEALSDLAMKMGADTVFSASDASKAMLELARGGMTAATIQGGALQGTLTLAAAGELSMADAANIAVKSMGQFNLEGKDASSVAAALAGGANASSASVEDMAYALAQGGLAANSVGFSLQETTGILAAFSNNGLEGSDAGTSLKTALDRLQPTTESATTAMMELGAITEDGRNRFLKANGEFESAAKIAQVLKEGTEDLSESERKRLITQAFGSDAQRAATILAKEGAAGLKPLIKATSDQAAAQKMADANMAGTAGAIEAFKGSVETATLQFGQFISPAVVAGLHLLTDGVNNIAPAFGAVKGALAPVPGYVASVWDAFNAGGATVDAVRATLGRIGDALTTAFGGGAGEGVSSMLDTLKALGATIAANVLPFVTQAGAMFRDVLLPAVEQVVAAFITHAVPVLQTMADTFQGVVLPAVVAVAGYLVSNLLPIFKQWWTIISTQVLPIVGDLALWLYGTLYPAVIKIVSAIATNLVPVFDAIFRVITTNVLPAVSDLLTKFKEWLPTIKMVIGVVLKVVGAVLTFAAAILGKVLPPLIRFAGFMLGVVVSVISTVIGWVIKIIGWVVDFGVKVFEAGAKVVEFVKGLKAKFGEAVDWVKGIPDKIAKALGDLGGTLTDKGKDLITGLWEGIKGMGKWLAGKLADFVTEWIPGPIAKALGIDSPSKVMAAQAKWIPRGMAQGIESEAGTVQRAMDNIGRGLRVPRVPLDAEALGAAAAAGGRGGVNVHIDRVEPHDYRAFMGDMQRRTQRVALGGFA